MSALAETKDLCINCDQVDFYLVPGGNSRRPIMYCEQYNDFNPAEKLNPLAKSFSFKITEKNPPAKEFNFKGLCVNCENRLGCSQARTESGIWHCEEYC